MSSPSNLYAEKIFSEHPISLWALDENADYVSLISESNRDLSSWVITGGTSTLNSDVKDEPFINSHTNLLTGNLVSEDYGEIVCISPTIKNFSDLNLDLSTFTVGSYIYSDSPYITSIEIGYQYLNQSNSFITQKLKMFETSVSKKWFFVSDTFDIPYNEGDFQLVLKIKYINGSDNQDDYKFYANGLSLGQWAEEFHSTSLGLIPINLPSNISLPSQQVVPANAYGLKESLGYYFVRNNSLMAKNSGIPLVYGSSNVTVLYPNEGKPSLIIPGNGMFNEKGKHSQYTLEMWMRINCDSVVPKRIAGPISSTDGLYVSGPFFYLKVGDKWGSYYVGEWYRPMLIHIRYSPNTVSLLINGEQVISIDINVNSLSFPTEILNNKSQDWIGFYAYSDVSPIDIDCIALYSYQVPSIVAKRRFVYGQGVEFPENINKAYSGTSIYIDYPFADYTNNYNYPDIGRWDNGIRDNLSTTDNLLSVPSYSLPNIVFSSKTLSEWQIANGLDQIENEYFFTLKPSTEGWSSENSYILFDSINTINEETKAFFGVFKTKQEVESEETLFVLENEISNSYLTISILGNTISYKLKYGSQPEQTLYQALGHQVGETFTVGINIESFSNYFGSNVASFFGTTNQLKVYVGGNKNLNKTFSGNIYKIGFCSDRNLEKLKDVYNEFGVPLDYENVFTLFSGGINYDAGNSYFGDNQYFWSYILDGGDPYSFATSFFREYTASYTLVPSYLFSNFKLDIAAASYWEDYIPLTYFAQFTSGADGDQNYDLDFIQFNINYPAPSKYKEEETIDEDGWSYSELQLQYSNPIQRTYDSLDNQLFTGYTNYEDLAQRSTKEYSYDTSSSILKTYITFQYIVSGANAPEGYFINTEPAPKNGVVRPGNNWINTRYEVVDNMVIYPPKGIDVNDLAIVMHLEFNNPGISDNPIKIRSLQLASQALNESSPNPINTRFGTPIYPYKKSGIYFDYKYENPFSIYKGSSPYLYMNRYSGIQLRGDYDPMINRGLAIPINSAKSDNYKVIALQTAVKYDQDFFPYAPTEVFEIETRNKIIKFYMVAIDPSGQRAKIYAVNASSGKLEDGVAFFWNGRVVKDPVLTVKQWGFLGMSFSDNLIFNQYAGNFRINGPLMVNTVSHYQSTNLQEVQQVSVRQWFRVKYSGIDTNPWQYWDSFFMWQGVLVLATASYYGVDPEDIYKTYTGTNKFIIDDTRPFRVNTYEYTFYKDASWQRQTLNPV